MIAIKEYVLFGIILLCIDLPFINCVMHPEYKKIVNPKNINLVYIFCAYLIMVLSWTFIKGNVLLGALTGFVIYGVYAFTLLTILPKYTFRIGMMELVWGTFLFTVATFLTNKCKQF
jgi:uncharacterized membrane protein